MRIAIVVERFEAGAGGVEDVAWQAAHGLARAGEDVHVVCRAAGSESEIPVDELRTSRVWQPLRVLRFDSASRRAVGRGDFDLVHSWTRTRQQDVYFAGGGSHVDYMLRQYSDWGGRLRRLSPRHVPLLAIERHVFTRTEQIIHCNSEMVARQIGARFDVSPERFAVIHNGVDLERYRPGRHQVAAQRLRDELAAGPGPAWVFMGTGFPRKGLDTALRALQKLGGSSELWVVGRDAIAPWEQLASRLGVRERVRFLGYRSDTEVIYAAADGLILPTRYDSFSTVCLEAAASGIPVLTSGTNGAGEFIETGGAGRMVCEPEDLGGFAKGLDELEDPVIASRCGQRGRELAESCGWDTHVEKLRQLYRRVLEQSRSAGSNE
jgi:UDP-glucose:(heptosyl)LPS alpha-1,3-glucosyltransferase